MNKHEKETILRWDSAEKIVHVYSCHPSVWRRVEKQGFTPVKRSVLKGVEIARQYRVPLDCFRYGSRTRIAPPACPALAREGQHPSEKEWEMNRILSPGGGELAPDERHGEKLSIYEQFRGLGSSHSQGSGRPGPRSQWTG